MQKPVKGIWISNTKIQVAPVMLKPLAILSPTKTRRFTVK